jgi:undecaprenyl-diphosphatase
MDGLLSFDQSLFVDINSGWSNPFFDLFFPLITDLHRNPWFLVLLVLLCGFWVFKRRQRAVAGLLCLALTLAVTDAGSSQIIKPLIARERPSQAGVPTQLRTHRHSGLSFPSNHATNIFGAATVLSALFPPATLLWYFFALLIALSRVYVGVHFPLDVLGGALLGVSVGWLMSRKLLPVLTKYVERRW